MATTKKSVKTTPKARSASKTTNTKGTTKAVVEPKNEAVNETNNYTAPVRTVKQLDPNSIVTVKNGFNGTLVYKSKRTGERFVWAHFGDEQDMELSELKSAKNSYKSFFINNWFLIDDPDVIEYLGVGRYYDSALSYDEFKTFFNLSPEEITARIPRLSAGQRNSLIYRAKELAANGEIDSLSVVSALEKGLGVQLLVSD